MSNAKGVYTGSWALLKVQHTREMSCKSRGFPRFNSIHFQFTKLRSKQQRVLAWLRDTLPFNLFKISCFESSSEYFAKFPADEKLQRKERKDRHCWAISALSPHNFWLKKRGRQRSQHAVNDSISKPTPGFTCITPPLPQLKLTLCTYQCGNHAPYHPLSVSPNSKHGFQT